MLVDLMKGFGRSGRNGVILLWTLGFEIRFMILSLEGRGRLVDVVLGFGNPCRIWKQVSGIGKIGRSPVDHEGEVF